jgi:cell division protease FtsH
MMMFNDVTTGPSNDLQVSTALARDMVTKYGMSEKLGALALEGEGGRAMFGGRGVGEKEYSDKTGDEIDAEVSKIMTDAYKRTHDIITQNRKLLDVIAKRLIDVKQLNVMNLKKFLLQMVSLQRKNSILSTKSKVWYYSYSYEKTKEGN